MSPKHVHVRCPVHDGTLMKAAHPGATPAHQRRAWSATRVLPRVDVEPISAVQSSSNQFQKSTTESDGTKVLATPTPTVLPTATPKAQVMPTLPSKRAAESTTLDVHLQAKHLRCEGSQMEVQSITVAIFLCTRSTIFCKTVSQTTCIFWVFHMIFCTLRL